MKKQTYSVTDIHRLFLGKLFLLALLMAINIKFSFSQSNPIFPNTQVLKQGTDSQPGAIYLVEDVELQGNGGSIDVDALLYIVSFTGSPAIVDVDVFQNEFNRFEPSIDYNSSGDAVRWRIEFIVAGSADTDLADAVPFPLEEYTLEIIDLDTREWAEVIVPTSYTLEGAPTGTIISVSNGVIPNSTRFTSANITDPSISVNNTRSIVTIKFENVDAVDLTLGKDGSTGTRNISVGFLGEVNFGNPVTVQVNSAPSVLPQFSSTTQNTPTSSIDLLSGATDAENNIDVSSVILLDPNDPMNFGEVGRDLTIPSEGTYVLDNTGNVVFTPVTDFTGSSQVEYRVNDDNSASSNTAILSITVGSPALAITKISLPTADVLSGDTISYTIEVENTGTFDASQVTISDVLPAGFTYVDNSTVATVPMTVYDTAYSTSPGSFLDEFETSAYNNSDGLSSWSSYWIESGDDRVLTSGTIQIEDGVLKLQNLDYDYIERPVDLRSADTSQNVILSWSYFRVNGNETVAAQLLVNGAWVSVNSSAAGPASTSHTLTPAQIAGTTRVRFYTNSGGWSNNEQVNIHWIKFSFTEIITTVTSSRENVTFDNINGGVFSDLDDGIAPSLVVSNDAVILEPSETLTVTFKAKVGAIAAGVYTNTATADASGLSTSVSASAQTTVVDNFDLSTDSVTQIGESDAQLYARIIYARGIVEYGFYFSTDTAESDLVNGSADKEQVFTGTSTTFSNLAFSSNVSGLTNRNAYYFRAYILDDSGTYHYGKVIRFLSEKRDFSIKFGGVNDCLLIDEESTSTYINDWGDAGNTFSVDFWMKKGSDNTVRDVLICDTSSNQGYYIDKRKGSIRFSNANGNRLVTDSVLVDEEWHHIAVSYDNGTAKIHFDGVMIKSGTLAIDRPVQNTNCILGGAFRGTDSKIISDYDGYLDALRFWNVTLSDEQVSELLYDNVHEGTIANSVEGVASGKVIPSLGWDNLTASLGFNVMSTQEGSNEIQNIGFSYATQDEMHNFPFLHNDARLSDDKVSFNIVAVSDVQLSPSLPRVNWRYNSTDQEWLTSGNWGGYAYPGQGITAAEITAGMYGDVTTTEIVDDSVYCKYTIVDESTTTPVVTSTPPEVQVLIDRHDIIGTYHVDESASELHILQGVYTKFTEAVVDIGEGAIVVEEGAVEVHE